MNIKFYTQIKHKMKKLLLMCLLAATLMGCNVTPHYELKFSIGMTEEEFKNLKRSAVQVYGDERNILIYRTYNAMNEHFKFFRFTNQKLVQFSEGIYADDYKLLSLN